MAPAEGYPVGVGTNMPWEKLEAEGLSNGR